MKNIRSLEKQVRAVSIANRERRQNIVRKCNLLKLTIATTARKPVTLGLAVLIGFGVGIRKTRSQPVTTNRERALSRRLIPLLVSFFLNTTLSAKNESG